MYRTLLTKRFFDNNPYKEFSAARITLITLQSETFEERAMQLAEQGISPERMAMAKAERVSIENEENPQVLLKYLRSNIDGMNRPFLIRKALEYEAEILPGVVQRLMTSGNDHFIETAVRLLGKSREDHTAPLVQRYDEIRNPYTQSLLCVVLGLRGKEDIIPWVYEKYMEAKRLYPEETYSEGPLIALYELKSRFYRKS